MSKRAITDAEQAFNIVNTNATNGATKHVERFDMPTAVVEFHSFDASPGSFTLQGSIDGTNWSDIQATIVAEVRITFTHFWKYLRVRCVTAGGAAPVAVLGAYENLY